MFFDDKLLFSIGLFGPVSAVSVDFFFHLNSFSMKSVSHEAFCYVFLYSHLYHMFLFWNMFEQDEKSRNIDGIIDVVLLLYIFYEYP